MSQPSATRVPVDDAYAALVGKAVYVFAYYEWSIIWIIENLQPGFVGRCSRGEPMTSANVLGAFRAVIDNAATGFSRVTRSELEDCWARFKVLIVKRNALIHAHPATDTDGAQILVYQTKVTKPLPDMKWPKQQVETALAEFDEAACGVGAVLDKLRWEPARQKMARLFMSPRCPRNGDRRSRRGPSTPEIDPNPFYRAHSWSGCH